MTARHKLSVDDVAGSDRTQEAASCGLGACESRPVRVLHVEAGTQYGGSHKVLATYLKASVAPNLQHRVLLVHTVPEFEAELRGICPVNTLAATHGVASTRPWDKQRILRFWTVCTFRILRFLAHGGFDLVHINNTFTFQPYTLLACRLLGLPVVAHVRNPIPDSWFARLLASMPQMIVTINSSLSQPMRHWRTQDLQVCYDGVQLGVADPEAANRLRTTLLGDGNVLIGSMGRLDHQKGYDLFVEAAAKVIATCPGARFAIAGEGPLHGALERRIGQLGMRGTFHLTGFHADVATFLAALDVFVCSSRYEGGPCTVAEALLMGKPVISTSVGFVPELSLDGQHVRLIPTDDVEALADAIHAAMSSIENPLDHAEAARARVLEFTEPRRAAENFDRLLCFINREAQFSRSR